MLDVPFRSARQLAVDIRRKKLGCLELLEQVRSSPVLEVVLNGVDFDSPEYRLYDYAHA